MVYDDIFETIFDSVRSGKSHHFMILLKAHSKTEYQTKVRLLYEKADEIQVVTSFRTVIWMKQKNFPEKFSQVWELIVFDPMVKNPGSMRLEF